jgi:hypothetical protein
MKIDGGNFMDFKDSVRFQLEHARRMTNNLIREFTNRGEWIFQPHPDANNAIWIISHLGLADNHMMAQLRPETDYKPESLTTRYWFGSKPSGVDKDNVSTDEALAYFHDRRENLMNIFDEITDKQWRVKPPADSTFANFPSLGHIFLFNSMHEGIHFGQLSVCHRALGNPPLRRPD